MNAKGFLGMVLFLVTTPAFAAIGDYKETTCTAEYFTANNCSACFEGIALWVGDQINGLYDTWTNNNTNEQIIYKDEQTLPEMVSLSSGTTFVANPLDASVFWKFGSDVIWTDSATGTGKQEFMLDAGKSIRFIETDLGASYTLASTDKADGETVGILKFPLNYHNVDADGNEGGQETHIECVAYTAKTASVIVAPTVEVISPEPIISEPTTPEPTEMTTVKTGPGSLILMTLTLLIATGFIIIRNRKV